MNTGKVVEIDNKRIGGNNPTYVIAEVGGGLFKTFKEAKEIINAAKTSGADIVKLQTFKAKTHVSKHAFFDIPSIDKLGYVKEQIKVMKSLELTPKMHEKIFDYCKKANMSIFSTPSHKTDVDLLEGLGVTSYKLGSDDATNMPLIKYIGRTGKPLVLSTGMCTMDEVKEAVKTFHSTGNDNLILLHCVRYYPCERGEVNLLSIRSMIEEFDVPIGYSDHTLEDNNLIPVTVLSVMVGAKVIEKHFTLDKTRKDSPDHMLSADSTDLKNIVKIIRTIEKEKLYIKETDKESVKAFLLKLYSKIGRDSNFVNNNIEMVISALGDGIKRPTQNELKSTRIQDRKSIVAFVRIPKGTVITEDMICEKRPGTGIPPRDKEKVVGKIATIDIEEDDLIQWNQIK